MLSLLKPRVHSVLCILATYVHSSGNKPGAVLVLFNYKRQLWCYRELYYKVTDCPFRVDIASNFWEGTTSFPMFKIYP